MFPNESSINNINGSNSCASSTLENIAQQPKVGLVPHLDRQIEAVCKALADNDGLAVRAEVAALNKALSVARREVERELIRPYDSRSVEILAMVINSMGGTEDEAVSLEALRVLFNIAEEPACTLDPALPVLVAALKECKNLDCALHAGQCLVKAADNRAYDTLVIMVEKLKILDVIAQHLMNREMGLDMNRVLCKLGSVICSELAVAHPELKEHNRLLKSLCSFLVRSVIVEEETAFVDAIWCMAFISERFQEGANTIIISNVLFALYDIFATNKTGSLVVPVTQIMSNAAIYGSDRFKSGLLEAGALHVFGIVLLRESSELKSLACEAINKIARSGNENLHRVIENETVTSQMFRIIEQGMSFQFVDPVASNDTQYTIPSHDSQENQPRFRVRTFRRSGEGIYEYATLMSIEEAWWKARLFLQHLVDKVEVSRICDWSTRYPLTQALLFGFWVKPNLSRSGMQSLFERLPLQKCIREIQVLPNATLRDLTRTKDAYDVFRGSQSWDGVFEAKILWLLVVMGWSEDDLSKIGYKRRSFSKCLRGRLLSLRTIILLLAQEKKTIAKQPWLPAKMWKYAWSISRPSYEYLSIPLYSNLAECIDSDRLPSTVGPITRLCHQQVEPKMTSIDTMPENTDHVICMEIPSYCKALEDAWRYNDRHLLKDAAISIHRTLAKGTQRREYHIQKVIDNGGLKILVKIVQAYQGSDNELCIESFSGLCQISSGSVSQAKTVFETGMVAVARKMFRKQCSIQIAKFLCEIARKGRSFTVDGVFTVMDSVLVGMYLGDDSLDDELNSTIWKLAFALCSYFSEEQDLYPILRVINDSLCLAHHRKFDDHGFLEETIKSLQDCCEKNQRSSPHLIADILELICRRTTDIDLSSSLLRCIVDLISSVTRYVHSSYHSCVYSLFSIGGLRVLSKAVQDEVPMSIQEQAFEILGTIVKWSDKYRDMIVLHDPIVPRVFHYLLRGQVEGRSKSKIWGQTRQIVEYLMKCDEDDADNIHSHNTLKNRIAKYPLTQALLYSALFDKMIMHFVQRSTLKSIMPYCVQEIQLRPHEQFRRAISSWKYPFLMLNEIRDWDLRKDFVWLLMMMGCLERKGRYRDYILLDELWYIDDEGPFYDRVLQLRLLSIILKQTPLPSFLWKAIWQTYLGHTSRNLDLEGADA